jgi:homocysteine S-methyltransferase
VKFAPLVQQRTPMLAEGSIYERLRRHASVQFDPHLAHATLIYTPAYATMLEAVHREYWNVARTHRLPMVALTDTWRANLERLKRSIYVDRDVNQDNVRFLKAIRANYGAFGKHIFIGGDIGPRGDAYKPQEALARTPAERFHTYQIEALAEAGPDFLFAATLPAFSEAHGIAHAMARTGLPYILSFVIRPTGTLLDGIPLRSAIELIDATVVPAPLGYSVNCVHPSVLADALVAGQIVGTPLLGRLINFQANTSALPPEQLDNSPHLHEENPQTFAAQMAEVRTHFGIPILGGCCGTDTRHIARLAEQIQPK